MGTSAKALPFEVIKEMKRFLRKEDFSFLDNPNIPIFFHCPSGDISSGITGEVRYRFRELCNHTIKNNKLKTFSPPPEVGFFTYSNYQEKTLIEKCYETYGVEHITLAKDIQAWTWIAKIQPMLSYLQSNKCSFEYIVATDANDVLMVGDPEKIIEKFQQYDCKLLFCNTLCDWPPNKIYRDFEIQKNYTHPLHSHLSAGGYIGQRKFLIECLNEISQGFESQNRDYIFNGKFDDQLAWRCLHYKYYPEIKVDFKSLIFKRFDIFKELDY